MISLEREKRMTNLGRIKDSIQQLPAHEFREMMLNVADGSYKFGFRCCGKLLCNRDVSCEQCFCDWLNADSHVKFAYIVQVKDEFTSSVVFADSYDEAVKLALDLEVFDCYCEDDLKIRRLPKADVAYKNRDFMDFEDPADRLFLVKECGFYCEYVEPDICKICESREFCSNYEDYLESLEGEEMNEACVVSVSLPDNSRREGAIEDLFGLAANNLKTCVMALDIFCKSWCIKQTDDDLVFNCSQCEFEAAGRCEIKMFVSNKFPEYGSFGCMR